MSESAKQDAELAHLEATISDEAYQQVGVDPAATMPQAEAVPETREVVQPLLEMGFAILAPNWNVQPAEVEQLSGAYAALLDKYFPEGLGDHGVEINAVLITGAIVLPRLRLPRKVELQETAEGGRDGAEAE